MGRTRYNGLPYDQFRDLRKRRGYHRKDSREALETRLALINAAEERRVVPGGDAMDTSETVVGDACGYPWRGLRTRMFPYAVLKALDWPLLRIRK